jgi:hypothetical protein
MNALTGVVLIEGITGARGQPHADVPTTRSLLRHRRRTWCAVVVPPAKTATVLGRTALEGSRSDDSDGDGNRTTTVEEASGYHRQARAENAFFRINRSSEMLFELAVQKGRWPRHSSHAMS